MTSIEPTADNGAQPSSRKAALMASSNCALSFPASDPSVVLPRRWWQLALAFVLAISLGAMPTALLWIRRSVRCLMKAAPSYVLYETH
jgi:hypothetical protein